MNELTKVTQMGLDGHKNFSIVCARDAQGRVVRRQRVEHLDRTRMREQLSAYPPGTPVVMEGTFGWGSISEELKAAKLDPHLASSRKVSAWREARGIAKSNRTDADLLGELWSERGRWWEVWLAPAEVRDRREWLRHRIGLVKMQTTVKNRIHSTLHRHGVIHQFSDLFGTQGRRFLSLLAGLPIRRKSPKEQKEQKEQKAQKQQVPAEELPAKEVASRELPGKEVAFDGLGDGLSESGRETLRGLLTLLDQLRRLIGAATREIRRSIQTHRATARLRSLPGIGWVLAQTIIAEIGEIERFPDARHLCSYSLLTPIAQDSGEDDGGPPMGRHVGHAGRRTLKWAFIEAAHGAVRSGGRFREILGSPNQRR